MPGLFGTRAPLLADLVLVVEALVAALLVYGYLNIRRGRIPQHRRLMTLATFIQSGAVALLMIPASLSYRSLYPDPGAQLLLGLSIPFPMLLGTILLGLGLFLVGVMANYPQRRRWRPRRFKLVMQVLWVGWGLTMAGGVLFNYLVKYVL